MHVGIQLNRDAAELIPADASEASWRTEIDVVELRGARDFRGPAVQGKRNERFVYLVWVNVDADGAQTRLGRAKLMLDDLLPAGVDPFDTVTARVDLTDESGRARCARLPTAAVTVQHS